LVFKINDLIDLKGVILAGGLGTRLLPFTQITNKHLIPVYDSLLIDYGIKALKKMGLKDLLFVLGGPHGEDVRKYLGSGDQYDLAFHYVWQGEPKGIGHAVLAAEKYVEDDSFILYCGDNIFPNGITQYISDFNKCDCDARLLLKHVKYPERYGVAELNQGKIMQLVEKPIKPISNYAITGCYCLKPTIFHILHDLKPSQRNELEITDALSVQLSLDEYNVGFRIVNDQWFDCGTFDAIFEASTYLKNELYS